MIKTSSYLFAGAVLLSACGSTDEPTRGAGTQGSGGNTQGGGGSTQGNGGSPHGSGGSGALHPCGNLDKSCAALEYCLISRFPKIDRMDLIMTSDCEPFPPPNCPANGSMDEVCQCLIDDAKAKNSNCSKIGVAFSCNVHTANGAAPPEVELTCNFIP